MAHAGNALTVAALVFAAGILQEYSPALKWWTKWQAC